MRRRRSKRKRTSRVWKRIRFIFLLAVLILVIFFIKNKLQAEEPPQDLGTSNESFFEGINFLENIGNPSYEYKSEYIYLLSREDGEVLKEKNHKKKTSPASLTKMMTVLVALENIDDLSEVVPVDVDTYQAMVARGASMAGFYGKELVTYRDLLYGTMLNSGGEAANTLAVNISGDRDSFVRLMNERAREIGLENTHFINPEGLDEEGQYTTAYDMGVLLDYALDNNQFSAIFTRKEFKTTPTPSHPEGILLESTVLSELNEEDQKGFQIVGGKSGTTYNAGQCWATLAVKNGKEYVVIVMGVPIKNIYEPSDEHIEDTLNLVQNINSYFGP